MTMSRAYGRAAKLTADYYAEKRVMDQESLNIIAEHERCSREAEAQAKTHRDEANEERGRGPSTVDLRRRLEELRHDAMLFDCNAMGAGVLEDLDEAFESVKQSLSSLSVWTEPDA